VAVAFVLQPVNNFRKVFACLFVCLRLAVQVCGPWWPLPNWVFYVLAARVLKNEAKLQQPGNNNQQVKNNKPHKTAHDRQSLYSDQHTRTTNKENSKAQIRFKTAVCHYPVNKVGVRFLMSMVEGNEARLNPVPDTS
jgi:hypothetical protein